MKLTFPSPAPNEPSQRASSFFDAIQDVISYLYARWMDEREHENINDYKLPLIKFAAERDIQIVKMTGRPFGLHFIADSREYKVSVKSRSVECKRVK